MITFGLILTFLVAIVVVLITWKVSNFFLSRRDFYRNSPFEIFMIKLGWCLFWFLFVMLVGIEIVKS
jgi:hypothetical protein